MDYSIQVSNLKYSPSHELKKLSVGVVAEIYHHQEMASFHILLLTTKKIFINSMLKKLCPNPSPDPGHLNAITQMVKKEGRPTEGQT